MLEQVSNLPDNKWMIYVLRHSHGLEDYATAKGSVKLKKRRCILTLTINSASIVVCITPPLILVYRVLEFLGPRPYVPVFIYNYNAVTQLLYN